MGTKRLHAFFSGRVQGVGFRYTAQRIAEDFPVTGFVRNLQDGRVELLIEGEEKDLENFLQKIRKSFLTRYIDGVETRWLESSGEFQDFGITY
jgi:acylphosphatase